MKLPLKTHANQKVNSMKTEKSALSTADVNHKWNRVAFSLLPVLASTMVACAGETDSASSDHAVNPRQSVSVASEELTMTEGDDEKEPPPFWEGYFGDPGFEK